MEKTEEIRENMRFEDREKETTDRLGSDKTDGYTLQIKNLKTYFHTHDGRIPAVDDVSIDVPSGSIIGVVGESGCGKSVTALSIMGLIRKPGEIESGSIILDGRELVGLSEKQMKEIRGNGLAMIFQEPMTSLNPVVQVGKQVREAILVHRQVSKEEAKRQVIEIFGQVGIPEPEKRYHAYPHQLSGGLRQRVMIGLAMVCHPRVLIADEPTTALDVTVEAQILELMKRIRDEFGTSIILITHNMGVVAQLCDYTYVMYAGKVMEQAKTEELFANTKHPYTRGLLKSIPRLSEKTDRLYTIRGVVPNLRHLPGGCAFSNRCDLAGENCMGKMPDLYDVKSDAGAAEDDLNAVHRVRCCIFGKNGEKYE